MSRQKYFLGPALRKALGDIKGKKLIDLGCGGGHNAHDFATKGAIVTCFDSSKAMLETAQRLYPDLTCIHGDGASLSKHITFKADIVVASQVFLTIPTRAKVKKIFKEVSKVLKKNGVFLFTDVHVFRREHMHNLILDYDLPKNFKYFESGFQYDTTLKSPDGKIEMKFKDTFWNISDYMSFAKAAGFTIDYLIEPKPLKNIPAKYKKHFDPFYDQPLYMLYKLRKA